MPLKLTVFPAHLPGRQLVLWEGARYVLGRSPSADFVIADPRVSNRHLLIYDCGKGWRVQDEGSKNGTRIDGRPLDSGTLDTAAWLNIGGVPALAEPQSRQATLADEQTRESRRAAGAAAGTVLAGILTARVLLTRCLDGLIELSGCERGLIWTYDNSGLLAPLMQTGPTEPRPSRGVVESVITGGRCCVVSDTAGAEAIFRRGSIGRSGIRALVVLPLESRDARLGALYADSLRPGKTFTELDVDLLRTLAAQAAVALGMSRLRDELNRLMAVAPVVAQGSIACERQG